jgi:hypothetical protein
VVFALRPLHLQGITPLLSTLLALSRSVRDDEDKIPACFANRTRTLRCLACHFIKISVLVGVRCEAYVIEVG